MQELHAHQGEVSQFKISLGGHELAVGSAEDGGDSTATPMDLLVASWTACMGLRARHYLRRNGITDPIHVECAYEVNEASADELKKIEFTVTVPGGIPTGRREAVARVVERCALHNPLHTSHGKVRVREQSGGVEPDVEKELTSSAR